MKRFILRLTLALVVISATGAVCGCRRTEPTPAPQPAPAPAPGPEPTATPGPTPRATVYFVRGERVGVAARQLVESPADARAEAAVEALLEGPTPEEREFGLGTTIPEGTTLNGVEIADGIATIDLSPEFGSGGGSLSMLLRVAQVVCTLTDVDGVESVAFRLDGSAVEALRGEGVIVDPPRTRVDVEGQLPAILVLNPAPGETVAARFTASGTSNVFEAVHQLHVADPEGRIVFEDWVMATSGTGTRGTWSKDVDMGDIDREGMGKVIVLEISPKDGSRQNLVEVPVRMTP